MLSAHNKYTRASMYVRSWIAQENAKGKPTRRWEGCPEAAPSLPMSVSQPEIAYRAQTISYFTFPPSSNPSSAVPSALALRYSACTAFHVFFMLYPLFIGEVRTPLTAAKERSYTANQFTAGIRTETPRSEGRIINLNVNRRGPEGQKWGTLPRTKNDAARAR